MSAVITQLNKVNPTAIQYLKRDGDRYFINVPKRVEQTFNYAHPVYTNAKSMTDKTGVSGSLRVLSQKTKARVEDDIVEVSETVAQMVRGMFPPMKAQGVKRSWVLMNLAFGQ